MSLSEREQGIINSLENSLDTIKEELKNKKVDVAEKITLKAVSNYIDAVSTGIPIVITVTATGIEDGETITARQNEKQFTGTLQDGTCDISVDSGGTWIIEWGSVFTDIELKTDFEGELENKKGVIYTYRVKQSESDPNKRVTYEDDALDKTPAKMNYSTGKFDYGDWADAFFVVENHVYALDSAGNRYKQCKDNDYSQFTDDTASGYNSTSSPYNFMASFPTCWIYRRMEGNDRVVSIADYKVDENYHAYGWEDTNGNVQEYMYLSAFEGSNVSNTLRSLGGQTIMTEQIADTERSYAEKNGTGWTTLDFCKWQAYIDLLVLVSKSTNTQSIFGYGYAKGNSAAIKTGTLYNKSQFWGEQTGKQAVKAFHVENPWGNVYKRCAGFVIKTDGRCYVKTYKPYNSDGTGYTMISDIPAISPNIGGYISAGKSTEYGFVATAATSGSENTYECDYGYYYKPSSGVYYSYVGGDWVDDGYVGAFYFNCNHAPSSTNTHFGASLSFTPQIATGVTA